MRIRSSIFAAALMGHLAVPGRASTVLFSQTPTNTNGFSITESRLADDFEFPNLSTVTDLLFYYTFSSGGGPNDLAAVSYAIYANSSGNLGTVFGTGTMSGGSLTRTGQSGLCTTCASATFSLVTPVALAGGTYWLELHNGMSLTDTSGLEIGGAPSTIATPPPPLPPNGIKVLG